MDLYDLFLKFEKDLSLESQARLLHLCHKAYCSEQTAEDDDNEHDGEEPDVVGVAK